MAKKVKVVVLITAGTNCDRETVHAFSLAGATVDRVHVNDFISHRQQLSSFDILVFPGGFSFGDDIAAGKVFANKLKFRLAGEAEKFFNDGKLIIGICNGFQVLVKMGLLPNLDKNYKQEVTLTYNLSGKFEGRWITLKTNQSSPCVFTRDMPATIQLPIAHGEGRFVAKDEIVLHTLLKENLVVFQYSDSKGSIRDGRTNPNGSIKAVAGICDVSGRILGLMPHPERFITKFQHPQWTRLNLPDEGNGFSIFRNAVSYVKKNL